MVVSLWRFCLYPLPWLLCASYTSSRGQKIVFPSWVLDTLCWYKNKTFRGRKEYENKNIWKEQPKNHQGPLLLGWGRRTRVQEFSDKTHNFPSLRPLHLWKGDDWPGSRSCWEEERNGNHSVFVIYSSPREHISVKGAPWWQSGKLFHSFLFLCANQRLAVY